MDNFSSSLYYILGLFFESLETGFTLILKWYSLFYLTYFIILRNAIAIDKNKNLRYKLEFRFEYKNYCRVFCRMNVGTFF